MRNKAVLGSKNSEQSGDEECNANYDTVVKFGCTDESTSHPEPNRENRDDREANDIETWVLFQETGFFNADEQLGVVGRERGEDCCAHYLSLGVFSMRRPNMTLSAERGEQPGDQSE